MTDADLDGHYWAVLVNGDSTFSAGLSQRRSASSGWRPAWPGSRHSSQVCSRSCSFSQHLRLHTTPVPMVQPRCRSGGGRGLPESRRDHVRCAGSAQGLGLGILRALAGAGANVVMHGLAAEDALRAKADAIGSEFDVRTAVSTADVTQPQQIRWTLSPSEARYACRASSGVPAPMIGICQTQGHDEQSRR